MPFTFVGYMDVAPGGPLPADLEYQRSSGIAPSPAMQQKMRDFLPKLPPTCKVLGSWTTFGGRALGVMVVEAESWEDLDVINTHYRGYLQIAWHPTRTGGVPRT